MHESRAQPDSFQSGRALANRDNAQKSTGPRTAAGKAASCLNARRHGFAARAPVTADAGSQVESIVQALCGENCDPVLREQAWIIADAQLAIRRIRMARSDSGDGLSEVAGRIAETASLAETVSLDRYERRALSRRRRAIARYRAIVELARGRGER